MIQQRVEDMRDKAVKAVSSPKNITLGLGGAYFLARMGVDKIASTYGHEAVAPLCGGMALTVAVGGLSMRHIARNGLPDVIPSKEQLEYWWEWYCTGGFPTQQVEETAVETGMPDWSDYAEGYRVRAPVLPVGWDVARDKVFEVDFRRDPHWLISGMTGEGKTRMVLRPLAAVAAMNGWQVIVLDRSGQHFRPLMFHPNIHVVKFSNETLWDVVHSISIEGSRRQQWLADRGATVLEGARADRRPPRTLIILDEFSNALTELAVQDKDGAKLAKTIDALMIRFVQEFRAVGINMAFVAQRPTHDQVSTTLRGQTMPIVFYLKNDREYRYAQVEPPDQELYPDGLPEGHCIVSPRRREGVIKGWHPTDDEIIGALKADRPRTLDPSAEWSMSQIPWLHGWPHNRLYEPVTSDTSVNDEGADRNATREEMPDQPLSPPAVTTNAHAGVTSLVNGQHVQNGTASDAPTPPDDNPLVVIMRTMLKDKRQSAIDGLSVGQVNSILLQNASGKQFNFSKNSMYPVVFGTSKNGRYGNLVKQVLLMYSNVVDPNAEIR